MKKFFQRLVAVIRFILTWILSFFAFCFVIAVKAIMQGNNTVSDDDVSVSLIIPTIISAAVTLLFAKIGEDGESFFDIFKEMFLDIKYKHTIKSETREYYKQLNKERKKLDTSYYLARKNEAKKILNRSEAIAKEINSLSLDIDCLCKLKSELIMNFNALIKLNEVDKIPMFPEPRKKIEEILGNWPNTINDFIDRSIFSLRKQHGQSDLSGRISTLLSEIKKTNCFDHTMNENLKSKIKLLENLLASNSDFDYIVDFDRSVCKLLASGKIKTYDILTEFPGGFSYERAYKIIDDMEFLGFAAKDLKPNISYERYFSIRPALPKMLENIEAEKEEAEKERLQEEINRKMEEEKALVQKVGITGGLDFSRLDAMKVILAMEENISSKYKVFYRTSLSKITGSKMFNDFRECCLTSKLPLAAEVRLQSLLDEYETKFCIPNPMYAVDYMDGHAFEYWCADLLKKNGFSDVEVTKGSGDQGVDVLAIKDGIRYAFQCKCYSSDLGNTPVQEVHAGKAIYRCQVGVVMTNRHFTPGAKELAEATGVLLWDREKLEEMIENASARG